MTLLAQFLRTERETPYLRLMLALGAAASLYLNYGALPESQVVPLALAYAGYTLYAVALRYLLLPRLLSPALVVTTTVVDVAALVGITHASGGIQTPFVIFYPVFITYYAVGLGYLGSFGFATAAGLALTGYLVTVSPGNELLPFALILFSLIAAIAGHVGRRLSREVEERAALEELLAVETGARSLLEVATALGGTATDPKALLARLVEVAPQITGLPRCIALLHEGNSRFVAAAANVIAQELGLQRLEELAEGEAARSSAERVCAGGKAVILRQPGEEPPAGLPPALAERAQRLLAIPLCHEGRALALLYAFDEVSTEPLPEGELQLAQGLGDLGAMALSNALAHQRSQEQIASLLRQLQEALTRLDQGRLARPARVINLGGLELDRETERVRLDGTPVELSPTEFRVLSALVDQPGVTVSSDTLYRKTWGDVYQGRTNAVDVYIHRLRKKLEEDPSAPKRILTVRGVGYKFARAS